MPLASVFCICMFSINMSFLCNENKKNSVYNHEKDQFWEEFERLKSYINYFPHNNVENVLGRADERRQKIIHFHKKRPSKTYSALAKSPTSYKTFNSVNSYNQLKLKAAYMKIRAFLRFASKQQKWKFGLNWKNETKNVYLNFFFKLYFIEINL